MSKSHAFKDLLEKGLKRMFDGHPGAMSDAFKGVPLLAEGLHDGDLIILAGRPRTGKTTLACQIMLAFMANKRRSALFFSLENSQEQLARRILMTEARVPGAVIEHGLIGAIEKASLKSAAAALAKVPIEVEDTPGLMVSELVERARAFACHPMSLPLGLIVVDYLQLLTLDESGKTIDREVEMGAIISALKELARELAVPILCTCQVSRAVDYDPSLWRNPTPIHKHLNITEQAAGAIDQVLYLYQDTFYQGWGHIGLGASANAIPGLAEICRTCFATGLQEKITLHFQDIPRFAAPDTVFQE